MNHEDCTIGSKPGVPGAYCFSHGVRLDRVGVTWKTHYPNTHPGGAR